MKKILVPLAAAPFAAFAAAAILATAPAAHAGKDDWQEVTAEDHAFVPANNAPAVLLFDKVVVDDRDLERNNMFTDYYRRIKICTPEGVRWGDIALDSMEGDEIKDIKARTIQPSGEILELNGKSIQQGIVLKAEGINVKRKSFSMPGCAPGAILEYKYRLKRSEPWSIWHFQSDLPLRFGELRWKNCQHWRHTSLAMALQLMGQKPSYTWINGAQPGRVVPLDGETLFEVRDVPALQVEPYAMPLESLQGGLRCYYGLGRGSQQFWIHVAGVLNFFQDRFIGENKQARKLVAEKGWGSESAADSIFNWMQETLTIIPARRASDIGKLRLSVDDVLKEKSGNQFDAAMTFIAILRAINVDAQIIYAKDGRMGRVDQELEDWQFDEFLVRVGSLMGNGRYYAPGQDAIEAGRIPWYLEGTEAIVLGEDLFRFEALPQSPPESNGMQSEIRIAMKGEERGKGTVEIAFLGHRARELRLKLKDESEANRTATLSKMIREDIVDAEIGAVEVEGLADRCGPLAVHANIVVKDAAAVAGDSAPINPFRLRRTPENLFTADSRVYPVSLGYSYSVVDVIELDVPPEWKGSVLGSDVTFKNTLGTLKTESQASEGKITSKRVFRLQSGYWPETLYKEGRELFSALEDTQALTHLVGP